MNDIVSIVLSLESGLLCRSNNSDCASIDDTMATAQTHNGDDKKAPIASWEHS